MHAYSTVISRTTWCLMNVLCKPQNRLIMFWLINYKSTRLIILLCNSSYILFILLWKCNLPWRNKKKLFWLTKYVKNLRLEQTCIIFTWLILMDSSSFCQCQEFIFTFVQCYKLTLAKARWTFVIILCPSSTLVSSTNKTDRHNITEILLKVALNTITLTS